MKKVLIALGLVVVMSFSAFAVSLELMNILNVGGAGNFGSATPLMGGVGLGFDLGGAEVIVGLNSQTIYGGTNTATVITLKGYMPVMDPLLIGLQIDSITENTGLAGETQTAMALLVGVKKTLVDGVDLRLDGAIYMTDGAKTNPGSDILNGGAQVSISCPIM